MYNNLALSGGAFKSIGLLGVVKYLEEIEIINRFKNYIGTSGGGIILFLILIGYKSNEIKNVLKDEIDYLTDLNFQNIPNMYNDLGIDDGNKNNKLLRKYLYSKLNLNSITFIEFAKKFGYNLILTGSNLTKERVDYFSIDTYPNMDIIEALLITSRVPLIYKPIKFNDDLYLDGALYCNFPVEYFEKNSKDTLGITIMQKNIKNYDNVFNLVNNVMFSLMTKLSYDNIEKNKDKYNICKIYFDNNSIDDINFSFNNMRMNIDKDMFNNYMNNGYNQFKEYYEKHLMKST